MARIPYVDVAPLFGVNIHSLCIAAAVLLGHFLMVWSAGAQRHLAPGFSAALLLGAAFGGHWLYLFLRPELLLHHPVLLIIPTAGASTLGALFGAVIAASLHLRHSCQPIRIALFNSAAWAFPFAWVLARLGCFLAHDQAALPYTGWLAVDYPTGPRHDLALYEMLYAAILAAVFFLARHRQWPFAAILLCSYGALRALIHPLRLALHTVDIVGATLVFAAGLAWLLVLSPRNQPS